MNEVREAHCDALTWLARREKPLNRDLAYRVFDEDKNLENFMQTWLDKYARTELSNPMEKFIYLWVTFNAWGTMVVPDRTRNGVDQYLIHNIAADDAMQDRFNKGIKVDITFGSYVGELLHNCPIIQVLWMRNNFVPPWDEKEERADFIERVRLATPYNFNPHKRRCSPAFAPSCSFDHLGKKEQIPMDWPHVLHAIYQIRCNLFHGGKTYDSERDRGFVELAYNVLWSMWSAEIPERIR